MSRSHFPSLVALCALFLLASLSGCAAGSEASLQDAARYHDDGELDLAIESYRLAIQRDPANAKALTDLASAYYDRGDILDASYACEKALSIDAENRAASALLARTYSDLGLVAEALPHAVRGTQTPAPDAFALWTLADVFLKMRRYGEAERLYAMTIASYSYPGVPAGKDNLPEPSRRDLGWLLFGMGLALEGQGRAREASALYQRAMTFMPDHPEIHFELGALAERSGKWAEALTHYREALRLDPAFDEALLRSGVALYHLGSMLLARDVLLSLQEGSTAGAEAAYMLGRIAEQRGFMIEAMSYYREARLMDETMGSAWLREGLLLERLGSTSEGMFCLERARLEGSSAAAWILDTRKPEQQSPLGPNR